MTRIEGYGLAATLPAGWEGEVFLRPGQAGEDVRPVLHAATFTLPPGRGDFGGGAVERMADDDILVALCEYGPDSAGTPLFAATAFGTLPPEEFHTQALQRPLPPQCGLQHFATVSGRAFCLYVVLGHHRLRAELAPAAQEVVDSLEVSPS